MLEPQYNKYQDSTHQTSTGNQTAISIIIVILLSLNLIATTVLVVDNFTSSESENDEVATNSEMSLPDNLKSLEAKMSLYDSIVDPFNTKDTDTIYDRMGSVLKAQLSREDFSDQLDVVYELSGQIENGNYSYYEAQPSVYGMTMYSLYYSVETESGAMELKIQLHQQEDDPYQITGVKLNF